MRAIKKFINSLRLLCCGIFLMMLYNHIEGIQRLIINLFKLGINISIIIGSSYIFLKFIKWAYYAYKWRYTDYTCFDISRIIKKMNPREFEIFIANLFTQLGYKAEATVATCDGGKDVIATNREEKIYIECKHWNINNSIGREILQKLVGSAVGDNATKAIVVTTSRYNKNAYEYAEKVPWLELWTIKDIIKTLNKIEDTKKGYILNCLEE
ncbi:restriction endonuclease [Clostridium botulinum]|nr:restriction endonuclease [Clostridium botulinum]